MIDIDSLKYRLAGFHFSGFKQTVEALLTAFEIGHPTIKKISDTIEKGGKDAYAPFYVYRRAVIWLSEDSSQETLEASAAKVDQTIPLVLIFTSTSLFIRNARLGSICCDYGDICNHVGDYLLPLLGNAKVAKQDRYLTLELDALVEQLYRSLVLDDMHEDKARGAIFNLLYMSLFKDLLDSTTLNNILARSKNQEGEAIESFYSFFRRNDAKFIDYTIDFSAFSKESTSYALAILKFDVRQVDAEILASMIYRMSGGEDADMFGHQTSYLCVEKVLRPLFVNALEKEVRQSTNENIYSVKSDIMSTVVFDPTNSPGSFLTATYNKLTQMLRQVEDKFDVDIRETLDVGNFKAIVSNSITEELTRMSLAFIHLNELKLSNEIDIDLINEVFSQIEIHREDALDADWATIVTPTPLTFIAGAPKFLGTQKMSARQKEQSQRIFGEQRLFNADLSSAWLIKAARLIQGTETKCAFVLTNSVTQGTQAAVIYDKIRELGCDYFFGYRSFKWNASSGGEGVTVVIIGIESSTFNSPKCVYDGEHVIKCNSIGSHLLPDIDFQVRKRSRVLSPMLPMMRKGNMPYGADPLIFTYEESQEFINSCPDAGKFMRPMYGSDEFVKGKPRYCLWITKESLDEAMAVPQIKALIDTVRENRSQTQATEELKSQPYRFREQNVTSKGKISVFVPTVTSENREYFQMGIVGDGSIPTNNCFVIFDCEIWLLALLESRMHMIWAKNACGGHETRPRYSSQMCYNTFPIRNLSKSEKEGLTSLARLLIETREKFCDQSLGQLYKDMPPELASVHELIDRKVDSIYSSKPFESDAERLLCLRELYETMLAQENG